MDTKRAGLLLSLFVLASSSALVSVAAAYGGWPTVSGKGSFTTTQGLCTFAFRIREFKGAPRGALTFSVANSEVMTLQSTSVDALHMDATIAVVTGTGLINDVFEVEYTAIIEDTSLDHSLTIRITPVGESLYTSFSMDGSHDFKGRITIRQ
jgi:hypothetical protein